MDEIIEIDENGKVTKVNTNFEMTRQEVIYFLENIKNEYLKKETYAESLSLIKRMEAFLESEK